MQPSRPIHILCLEDSPLDYELICRRLEKEQMQYVARRVDEEKAYGQVLREETVDIILSDYHLPGFDGLKALHLARELAPSAPFIFVSGALGEDVAIESLQHGAVDYITKQKLGRLGAAIRRALAEAASQKARHDAEASLHATQERLQLALDATLDGIWDYVIAEESLYWSPRFKEMVGYPPEWRIDYATWQEMLHPDDREHASRTLSRYLARDLLLYENIYRLRHKDGTYRWMHARGKASWDAQGKPLRVAGGVTDITERKQADIALHASEQRLRALTEAMPQLVWVARGSDGWCDYLSSQWAEYSGVPMERLLGRAWLDLLHAEDRDRAAAAWEDAVSGMSDYNIEYRILRRDGQHRWFKARGVPVRDEQGNIQVWYGTCTDIHDLKQAEANAEAANRAKSEFLANMSHEIRTPMNAVIGLANILAMGKNMPEKQREIISTLQSSAQSLLGLINDLLDIEKIETNNIDLEHIPFCFDDIIGDVFSVMAVRAREKNILLHCIDSPLKKQIFLGDPTRLRQIVMNLVSNAVKFTRQGGVTVHMSASKHPDAGMQLVQIHVVDTGIGIAQHKISSIFEKFTQADSTTTRHYGGTGLGLAICKNLAEIMNGAITVESQPGLGADFALHIPLQTGGNALLIHEQPSTHVEEQYSKKRGHVLLVEDYPPNIMVATNLLASLGYGYDVAHNGREAIALLRVHRSRYHAILMDVQMPDMDGFEATRLIRNDEKNKRLSAIPIIAMTAHALQGDKERCLSAGMTSYIAKPFQLKDLEQLLSALSNDCFLIPEG